MRRRDQDRGRLQRPRTVAQGSSWRMGHPSRWTLGASPVRLRAGEDSPSPRRGSIVMKPDRFYVYRHLTEDEGRVFYIGNGSGNRAWSQSSRNRMWAAIVKKHGFVVEIVECGLTEDAAFALETEYSLGSEEKLATFTLGGGGTSGYRHTDETRAKLSISHKGKPLSDFAKQKMSSTISNSPKLLEIRRRRFTGELNPAKKEVNRNISSERMTIKNPMTNRETVAKMVMKKIGTTQSEETKQKRSRALTGKPWSAARREAQNKRACR